MREIYASVTERGQVTIPAEVRKALGIGKRDKVIFAIDDGEVVLKKPRFTLETVYGALKPINRDIDEMIREAKDERAARLLEKMRKGDA